MSSPPSKRPSLAFIGGTGPEGRGLAMRFAVAGNPITVGSRVAERAVAAANELSHHVSSGNINGAPNREAADSCDMVVLTIPYGGLATTLPDLEAVTENKVVVSAIAPIEFHEGRPRALRVDAGSAAEEVRDRLPAARVASAFQTIDAHQLQALDVALDSDVIVCSDDVEARREVVALAGSLAGIRALSGGRLATSRYVEECTALLITLNRIYKTHSSLRIAGVPR